MLTDWFTCLLACVLLFYGIGSWLVLDNYLWGFTASDRDVHFSILWSIIMFLICIWLTSEPVVGLVDSGLGGNKFLLGMLGRVRAYVLAWGTVSLWRCFWYLWDEFLGGTTLLSASLAHALSLLLLTSMGCVSCINAPASTLGVDSIPHPECDDEPLFSMVPVPWESLYAFGLFRQVDLSKVDDSKRTGFDSLRPVSAGAIEMGVSGRGDVEASEGQEDGNIQATSPQEQVAFASPSQRNWHSWRPSLLRSDGSSYMDVTKPGLRLPKCSDYAQRPNEANIRSRSRLFRSR